MGKKFEIKGDDISDGYHTFSELYEHRIALYLAFCKVSGFPCFFKKDYETWFCLYCETPGGQISYHLPNIYLEIVMAFASESPDHKFDGHNSNMVLLRLMKCV